MDKSQVFNHYSHMLDVMLEDTLFFQYYFQSPFSFEECIEDVCCDPDWFVNCGATRVCLIDKAYDYVVKSNISGFKACEEEELVYRSAKDFGLEQYFTEPIFLGTYTHTIRFYDATNIETAMDIESDYVDTEWFENKFADYEDEFGELHDIVISLPLYAYPRTCHHNYNSTYDSLSNNKKKSDYEIFVRQHHSPLTERNLAVAIDFIREYGEDEYFRLTDFLYKENVNDLHAGNFGDLNGKFVCFDYGSYHSICCDDEYYSERT